MARVRLSLRAREGLRGILRYVAAQFGESVADRVLDRIEASLEMLATNPPTGHRREDITSDPQVRFWSVGPTLIAYRPVSAGGIEVLAIERGDRDWRNRISDDPVSS
ncbi:MAG: type II toxin-antitoxin system RelE/ParE family toxin [Planctomycetota bacterium]